MSIEIQNDLIIEGVSQAFDRFLAAHPDLGEKLLERMAELRCELMTPEEAAAMLGIARDTLRKNWREYGLEKSTILGKREARFFRSQVIAASRREGKLLRGRATAMADGKGEVNGKAKITPFPRRAAPTISPGRKEASAS